MGSRSTSIGCGKLLGACVQQLALCTARNLLGYVEGGDSWKGTKSGFMSALAR